MHVRPVRRDEIGDIAELWLELVAYHQAFDTDLPVSASGGEEAYARNIYQRLNQPDMAVFVAVNSRGEIVGYVYGFITELVPHTFVQQRGGILADIYVQPRARRQGAGKKLYDAIMDWFITQHNVDTVEWDVAARNTIGRAFWQAMGGREIMVRMQLKFDQNVQSADERDA